MVETTQQICSIRDVRSTKHMARQYDTRTHAAQVSHAMRSGLRRGGPNSLVRLGLPRVVWILMILYRSWILKTRLVEVGLLEAMLISYLDTQISILPLFFNFFFTTCTKSRGAKLSN